MTKYKMTTDVATIEFNYLADANEYNTTNSTSWPIVEVTESAPPADVAGYINGKIKGYQDVAPQLMRELYVANTMSGISTLQSDQMFDDYGDVLMRIREGAFPTAIRRLTMKRPGGFVTQALLDAWISKIQAYL